MRITSQGEEEEAVDMLELREEAGTSERVSAVYADYRQRTPTEVDRE